MTEVQGTRRQFRRDFTAKYKCEGCGYIEEVSGYDDQNFHVNVVPSLKCKVCEKSTNDIGAEIIDRTTVPSHVVI